MHLEFFDQSATAGNSPLHRASAAGKLLVVAAAVGGMLFARSPAFYAGALALLLILALVARLPLPALLELLAYPVVFAALFAFSGLLPRDLRLLAVARSATAALAVLVLFATTSYAEVFTALRLVLPSLLADVLLLTYRSFFVLLRELRRTLLAIKLKGGGRPAAIVHNVRAAGAVMGLTALHALEMSERMHRVLLLRGYRGVIPTSRLWWRMNAYDLLPVGAAGLLITLALTFR